MRVRRKKMAKALKIVKNDGPAEGRLGEERIPYKRGEAVEVPKELADKLLAQEGSGWEPAKPAASPKKAKEE